MTETKKTRRAADPGTANPKPKARGAGNRKKATTSRVDPAATTSTFGVRTRGSITDQLEGLAVNESIARSRRFAALDFADASKTNKVISKWYDSHNSSFCTAVKRVKAGVANKGKVFRIERGRFQTTDGATMCVITVTRLV